MKTQIYKGLAGQKKIQELVETIKKDGEGKQYDCMIGLSGGLDSTYLTLCAKEWGLRPLVLHIDSGWNTEQAIKNIEKTVSSLGFDLETYVMNWEEIRDMQLSFFRASVIDIDLPADIVLNSVQLKYAQKFGIKHVLSGHNLATEGWLPPNFAHHKYDSMNVRSIHRKFGNIKNKSLPVYGVFRNFFYKKILSLQFHSPLNFIDYNKKSVKKIVEEKLGWTDYGGKHYENIFTRFYQGYILPVKFKVHKRKSHLSVLICSGQITREEALERFANTDYPASLIYEDKLFFIKKLGITEAEFEKIMATPIKAHTDFPSYINYLDFAIKTKRIVTGKKTRQDGITSEDQEDFTLYYLLTEYPFAHGEPYFEDEIKVISKEMASIHLVLPNYTIKPDDIQIHPMPANTRLHVFESKLLSVEKIFGFFSLFNTDFAKEIYHTKNFLKVKIDWLVFKTMSDCFLRARKFYFQLDRLVSKNLIENRKLIFISYWCTEYVLALIWIKRKYPDVKIYSRFHAWDVYFERNKGAYLPFRKMIFDELDAAYMISEDGRNFILNRFPELDKSKFHVSHLGVLPAEKLPVKNQNKPFTVLSLSFVSKVKRLERIVLALEKINFPLHWIHIGDGGSDYQTITKLAEEKLDKHPFVTYEFKGKLTKQEVSDFLDTHYIDILINSSETEGIPVSIMECMARGIPAIAPRVGGIPEIIEDGKSGKLLSRVTNETEIAEAISYFNSLEEEQSVDYRKNAYGTWNRQFNAQVNYPKMLRDVTA